MSPTVVATCTACRSRAESYRRDDPSPDSIISNYCRECGSETDQLVADVRERGEVA